MKTLDEVVAKLLRREKKTTAIDSIDISTGEPITVDDGPKYLFRGESSCYSTIYSTRYRFEKSKCLSCKAKEEIKTIIKELDQLLQYYGLPPMWSASLLQHYGFPMEVIDATSSVKVAASFAASGNIGSIGRILVYPLIPLKNNAIVIDLCGLHWAKRPKCQCGYMIFHREYGNLLEEEIMKDIQVETHCFKLTQNDKKKYDQNNILCGDLSKDPTSGLLHKLVHDLILETNYSLNNKRISNETEEWLNKRIPWAPMPMKVVRIDNQGRITEVEPDFDKFTEEYA